ncbi:MAG: hypothetical protein LBJ60_09250 [Tannerellaceae bacterium]|jgi:hypothetical protein|nr:hypothetical protein [Tannerellaceae bacterium]
MKNCLCLLIPLFFYPYIHVRAVNNLRVADVRSIGMGGNEGVSSALFNPSLIALHANNRVCMNYFNRYGLKELGAFSGSLYLPSSILSFGADFSTFGYDAYRESQLRLLSAKQLNGQWTLGVGFQYAFLQTELFEDKTGQLSTDIGLTFAPVDELLIGVLIMNLPSVQLGDKSVEVKDFKTYFIQIGVNWEVINHVFIVCTVENNGEQVATGAAGIEYQPFTDFSIRTGIKGNPLLPSLGIGYCFSPFTVDAAIVYHPVLGMSSGIGLQFAF